MLMAADLERAVSLPVAMAFFLSEIGNRPLVPGFVAVVCAFDPGIQKCKVILFDLRERYASVELP